MVEKGKRKRVEPEPSSSSSSLSDVPRSPSPQPAPPKWNRHRAETRPCPICNEPIPLRLLTKHAELESTRLDDLIDSIGLTEIWVDPYDSNLNFASSSSLGLGSFTSVLEPTTTMTTTRRSAARARNTIRIAESTSTVTLNDKGKGKAKHPTAPPGTPTSLDTNLTKTLQTIKRNRKQRHAKLREMTREDEEGYGSNNNRHNRRRGQQGQEFTCPVCLAKVQGDDDILDAHVDACVAGEGRRLEEEREQREREAQARRATSLSQSDEYDNDAGGHVGDVRGTGFHTRDPNAQDVEEEVDIDGDDRILFGDVQFTEGDILGAGQEEDLQVDIEGDGDGEDQGDEANREPDVDVDVDVDIEGEDQGEDHHNPEKTLRDLIAEGRATRQHDTRTPSDNPETVKSRMEEVIGVAESDKVDLAILAAKRRRNKQDLVNALEEKVRLLESMRISSSTSLLCRICLDPYNEPTVSTGCWHTCCRECWLRCLGSTKLCPICKRITAAMDLRRVYL
ncbi:hypothetical protein D9758_004827 [Tetrapyrgos nigripes]|uniref:RING-type domain-containing protein n=1 Tax=Tetrapyrgos nigripes TaxID=182062 RepID=A0A8H5LJ15_9AGAR|nr:hypothetical protein D9758_004827 [Tetrapyrgos nigripes]